MQILSYADAVAIVESAYADGRLSACLASPRDAVELFPADWVGDDELIQIVRAIEAGSYEEFLVAGPNNSLASIESVRVVDRVLLRYLMDVWLTAPIFRCFFFGITMAEIGRRLNTAEAHDFFCENPCDFERVGQKLEIDRPSGWILARDRYDDEDLRFVLFGSPLLDRDSGGQCLSGAAI